MTHPFQGKNIIKTRRRWIRIFLIISFLLILIFSNILPMFVGVFNYVTHPVWEIKKTTINSTNNLNYLIRSKSSLLEENQKLKIENLKLKNSMLNFSILEKENSKLKVLFNRISKPSNFILSAILTKPNLSPYDTLNIDVGKKDGIKKGLKVYIKGDIPIGVISRVYSNTSLVELYSNPNKVTKGILNNSNIEVDIIGRGGGNFEMSVPIDMTVEENEVVTLPGLNTEQVAIVKSEISDKINVDKKFILITPVNIQNENWVLVKIK